MAFDYPSAADIDEWESLGNIGWGFDGLNPYMKKTTQLDVPAADIEATFGYSYDVTAYGVESPQHASYPDFQYADAGKHICPFLPIVSLNYHASSRAVCLVLRVSVADTLQ